MRSTVQRSPSSTITVSNPARARARAAKAPPAPEPITIASQLEVDGHSLAGKRFIAPSGREGSWREPTVAISSAKASAPWASMTIDLTVSRAGVPPSLAKSASSASRRWGEPAPSLRPVRASE